ncbi:MAG: manganese efflux pump [Bacteroidales bacterium]|nr:manganese efflux pump [Candidatus Cacconaster scatequi]
MDIISILLIAVAVSMDAFAVSLCKGLALKQASAGQCVRIGLWFGIFQASMPLLGFYLGESFHVYIEAIDHWIAFGLLLLIGANMIRDVYSEKSKPLDASLSTGTLFVLAIATSIDALAVGISFSCLEMQIFKPVCIIGATTFCLSSIGLKIGNRIGSRFNNIAQTAGGVILILIGIKILVSHLV